MAVARLSLPLLAALSLLASSNQLLADTGGQPLEPYGPASAGKGGIRPVIWAKGHPSPGSSGLLLRVDKGVGGAPAVLLTSIRPTSVPILGITALVDMSAPVAFVPWSGLLSGSAGQPGAGSANAAFPIPNLPVLAGLSLYSQFLLFDAAASQGLSASDGLHMQIQKTPLVVATGGRTLRSYNPKTGSYRNFATGAYPTDAQFNRDGSLCLLSGRASRSGTSGAVLIYDTSKAAMTLLKTVAITPGIPNHAVVHPNNKRAYVPVPGRSGSAIYIVNIERGSPGFGTVIGRVSGLPAGTNGFEGGSVSANGKVLCVCDLGLGTTRYLHVIDVDPQSPNRDKLRKSYLLAGVSGFMTDVEVGPQGIYAYACFAPFSKSSSYARIFLPTGRVMNTLTISNSRALFPTDIDIDARGRFLVACCSNSSNMVHIDLRPGPGFFKGRIFQRAPGSAKPFSVALTPDGSQAVATTMNKGIYAWDTTTLRLAWSVNKNGSGAGIAVR